MRRPLDEFDKEELDARLKEMEEEQRLDKGQKALETNKQQKSNAPKRVKGNKMKQQKSNAPVKNTRARRAKEKSDALSATALSSSSKFKASNFLDARKSKPGLQK